MRQEMEQSRFVFVAQFVLESVLSTVFTLASTAADNPHLRRWIVERRDQLDAFAIRTAESVVDGDANLSIVWEFRDLHDATPGVVCVRCSQCVHVHFHPLKWRPAVYEPFATVVAAD